MRELTVAEKDYWYGRALWPCCKRSGYLEGPRGGMSMNIKCPRCGTVMNVIDPARSHWWGWMGPAQMIEEPPGYTPPKLPRWRVFMLNLKRVRP
jgi:hypothetical protein